MRSELGRGVDRRGTACRAPTSAPLAKLRSGHRRRRGDTVHLTFIRPRACASVARASSRADRRVHHRPPARGDRRPSVSRRAARPRAGAAGTVARPALATIALGAALLIAQPIAERMLPPARARWISWPASLWMGFAFLLLICHAGVGAGAGAGRRGVRRRERSEPDRGAHVGRGVVVVSPWSPAPPACARRCASRCWSDASCACRAGRRRWTASASCRSATCTSARSSTAASRPRWWSAATRCGRIWWPSPAIWSTATSRWSATRSSRSRACAPRTASTSSPATTTTTPAPTTGCARVERLGIRALRNERVTIGRGDAAFDLAGVEDHHAHLVSGTQREDLPRALAGRDRAARRSFCWPTIR